MTAFPDDDHAGLTRRDLLQRTSLLIAGASTATLAGCSQLTHAPSPAPVRVGLITDIHYADKERHNTRYYRESLDKMSAAVASFNAEKVDFVVELGDLIDSGNSVAQEIEFLRKIESVYGQSRCPRHRVLGNHCVQMLTKEQFLAQCGQPRSYYSFDAGEYHFVILDGCFRRDGQPYGHNNFEWTDANISADQLDWLKSDLKTSQHPVIVFVHQRLDVTNHYGIGNQIEVRRCLEESGRVRLVLQGHNHVNDLKTINDIPYCTLTAVVEGPADSSAHALMTLTEDGKIRIEGFGRQESYSIDAGGRVLIPTARPRLS